MHFFIKMLLALSCCLKATNSLDLAGCGTTKQCIFNPPSCSQSEATCMVFTYQWNSNANTFNMEIRGGTGGGNAYSAIAFSTNTTMDVADLYYCTGNELKSGVIHQRYAPPITADSLPVNVNSTLSQTVDNVGECAFVRPASVIKTINSSPVTFDLARTEYHLLQAYGNLTEATPPQLRQHGFGGDNRVASANSIDYTASPSAPSGTASSPATSNPTTVEGRDDNVGCGVSVGCFRNPEGCMPGAAGCQFVSWVYDESANAFNFEMYGDAQGRYVAVAFGSEARMANADLYYCTATELFSGAITTQNQNPNVENSLPAEISNIDVETVNGVLRCAFTREASVTKTIESGPTDFDLSATQYYLLYANGPLAGDTLRYHSDRRMRTTNRVNFQAISTVGGSADTTGLVKAHAALMLIAWLSCASIGVIIARHYKPMWHQQTLFNTKVWFQLHRGLMVTALCLTLLAFILIFVAVGGYSTAGAHPVIGIIVTILAVTNPVMALFRPHPNTPNRPIFNWAHWLVGTTARILGIVAIFFGVDLRRLDLPEWDTWVLVGWVVFHTIVEVSLEVISAVYGHIPAYKRPQPNDKFDMGHDAEPPSEPRPKGTGLKYAILCVYAVVNVAFLLTFIVAIAMF